MTHNLWPIMGHNKGFFAQNSFEFQVYISFAVIDQNLDKVKGKFWRCVPDQNSITFEQKSQPTSFMI